MSRPLSRQQSVALVLRREQETLSAAPSTNSDFKTQMQYEPSQQSITDTPARASGRRHRPAPRGSQATTSTAASPSHHCQDQTEQAQTRRQGQSIHGSSTPQKQAPNNRSSQRRAEAERAVSEHPPALDDTPIRALYDAVHNLLNQGFRLEVVRKGYDQSIVSYFHHFQQDQSDSAHFQQCTTGLIAEIIERHADLKKHPAALAPDNIRKSQHRSNSPSRDPARGIPLDMAVTSSKVALPNEEDLSEQVVASPATHEGIDNPKRPPKLNSLKLGDLDQRTIKDEQAFVAVFREYALNSIKVGENVIDLLELARETVKHVKQKFEEREKNFRLPQRNSGQSRKKRPDTMPDKEIWQILFTIIANMFVFGLQPLCNTAKAMRKQSFKYDDAAAADISTGSNERTRRDGSKSNNGVIGHISQDILFKIVDKEALGKLAQSVRFVEAREDKSQLQLNKVYFHHAKLQMVRQYDAMTEKWKKDEKHIQKILSREGYKRQKGEKWPATFILSYIHQQSTSLHEKDNANTVALLSNELTKKTSELICTYRPVCSLVDAFGEGVLLLLRDNAKKHVAGKVGETWRSYPQHSRLRDVARSLRKVDDEKYLGQLYKLFTDLKKKVFKPALRLREYGSTGRFVFQYSGKYFVEKEEVGNRISFILGNFNKETDARSDVTTTQAGQHPLRRRMSHISIEEASERGQGPSKRRKTESIEDEEPSRDGSEYGSDLGQAYISTESESSVAVTTTHAH